MPGAAVPAVKSLAMGLRKRFTRVVSLLSIAVLAILAAAPQAMAADGVGLWGRTDDLVITLWAFGVMGFLTILVIVLSVIQIKAESRRERARAKIEQAPRD
jgi:hypothetical protein